MRIACKYLYFYCFIYDAGLHWKHEKGPHQAKCRHAVHQEKTLIRHLIISRLTIDT